MDLSKFPLSFINEIDLKKNLSVTSRERQEPSLAQQNREPGLFPASPLQTACATFP